MSRGYTLTGEREQGRFVTRDVVIVLDSVVSAQPIDLGFEFVFADASGSRMPRELMADRVIPMRRRLIKVIAKIDNEQQQ